MQTDKDATKEESAHLAVGAWQAHAALMLWRRFATGSGLPHQAVA